MKHLVFADLGKLEWQDAPDPTPGPGQAVVRPLAVSRCDLDIAMAAFGIFPLVGAVVIARASDPDLAAEALAAVSAAVG